MALEVRSDGILLSELCAHLDTLAVAYTVDFCNDGTWRILDSTEKVVYRGSQKECVHWLLQQPTA